MEAGTMYLMSGGDMKPKRMDSTAPKGNLGRGEGFASETSENIEDTSFKKKLEEIASGNVEAHRITNRTLSGSSADTSEPSEESDDPDGESRVSMFYPGWVYGDLSESSEEVPLMIEESAAENAERIVGEAVEEIAGVLGLSVFHDVDGLSFTEVGSGTRAHFAEIVFILKQMIHAFESGENIPSLQESQGTGAAGVNLVDTLRTGLFKVEMACSVLGISESVQRQVFAKSENALPEGIIQAIDPSTLTMAARDTERLFNGLFDSGTAAQNAAVSSKLKELLKDNADGNVTIVIEKPENTKAESEVSRFDSPVYRALLKIDRIEQVRDQNNEAALEKPQISKDLLSVAQNISESADGDTGGAAGVDLQPGTIRNFTGGVETRLSGALSRMTDDTVMNQITTKLYSVIRSGLTEVRVQLRPESLGEVNMRIRLEGDVVMAKIEVQNQQIKEILEQNLSTLKDALSQQHLTAGSVEIQIGGGTGRNPGGAFQGLWQGEQTAFGEGGEGETEQEDNTEHESPDRGETGKRYGSNSVEFFA